MTSTYDLSWKETSLWKSHVLFFQATREAGARIRKASHHREVASACSALSSTYLTLSGRGITKIKNSFNLFWLPITALCYFRMLPLSNHVVKLIGYNEMTADQCDIRQSILRARSRFSLFNRKKFLMDADECIDIAIGKNPEKSHTRGLLYADWADIKVKWGQLSGAESDLITALAHAEVAKEEEPAQASRIYRKCALVSDLLEVEGLPSGEILRANAKRLAEIAGAKDQLLKIRA
jgi:hypothetical protein